MCPRVQSAPSRLPRLAPAIVVASLVVPAVRSTAADDLAGREQALFALARGCVVRLVVDREPMLHAPPGWQATVYGSAVILGADPPADPRSLTLATTYHVLAGARSFRVESSQEGRVASSRPDSECFSDRSRELALVRIDLDPGRGKGLRAIDPGKPAPVPLRQGDAAPSPTGMAFGYSTVPTLPIDGRRVDFYGVTPATDLGLVRGIAFRLEKGQLPPGQMLFQLVGNQATLQGMSGGLAVDRDGLFAGLIFGRRRDQYNLIIPAAQVRAVRDRAAGELADGRRWPRLDSHPFSDPVLFIGGEDEPSVLEPNRLDWGTFEGLKALLGDDPLHEIEQFQEIEINPPYRGEKPPDLEIFVNDLVTTPNGNHKIQIWESGQLLKPNALGNLSIPLAKRPGETMLTVIKESGKVNDFEVSKLLIPSAVDLAFQYEGEAPFSHVVRSLPIIAQRYPLFITIVNDPRVKGPDGPARAPANARLALRLDYAAEVLNQAPFRLEVSGRDLPAQDRERLAEFEGGFRMADKAWQLRRISPQRLGLTMNGRVELKDETIRYGSTVLKFHRVEGEPWPPSFAVSGRFQFPYEMPGKGEGDRLGLAVSARATAARATGPLRFEVRPGLDFNVAGILGHLFTLHVSKKLIHNDQPHRIPDEKIVPFLEKLGFSSPAGWLPEIRRAVLVPAQDTGKDWLILTFRLDPAEGGGGGAPPPCRNLLEPPRGAADRVIEIEAWGVPGSLVQHFPGLKPDNPMAAAVLRAARAEHLSLTLDLPQSPDEWFRGLNKPGDLSLFRDNGRAVGERIQRALAQSVENAERIELVAQAGPTFARDVLRAVLNRPDPQLGLGPAAASLSVVARRGRGVRDVALTMRGGPLEVITPRGQEIGLGGDVTIRDARLKVARLEASGTFDGAEVVARIDAELSLGRLRASGRTFDDLSGRAAFAIHVVPGRRDIGVANVDDARATIRVGDFPIGIEIDGTIPVTIDRDLNFRFDPKLLKGLGPR